MCLEMVVNKAITYRTGHKTFMKDIDGLKCWTPGSDLIVPIGIWIDEEHYRPRGFSADVITNEEYKFSYPTGFHIFKDFEGAKAWAVYGEVIAKVQFDFPVAAGQHIGSGHRNELFEVVVAKRMKVLEIVCVK